MIHVTEEINAFDKIEKEGVFQALSPGGAISYIEMPGTTNVDALITVIRSMYENLLYGEINLRLNLCCKCSYSGEFETLFDEENKTTKWRCPECGNEDFETMVVLRRTCGYIGNGWNYGRTAEIDDRVLHL